jgi:hypothetical protein
MQIVILKITNNYHFEEKARKSGKDRTGKQNLDGAV